MAASSFTGEYPQRIDGKGRMSIPAEFRKVLDGGDAGREPGALPGVMVSHSPHLKDHFQGYTVDRFEEIGRTISAIRPATPEENRRKVMALRMHYGYAVRLEVDREGRVVLPLALRTKLGVEQGEVAFRGMGDSFELWNAAAFAGVDAEIDAFLAGEEDFDPAALASMLGQ